MMGTFVLCLVIILLRPLLCPRKKWIGIPNPKLTCPRLPITYRMELFTAAVALPPSEALRGPHLRRPRLGLRIVLPKIEEDIESLICKPEDDIYVPRNAGPASCP